MGYGLTYPGTTTPPPTTTTTTGPGPVGCAADYSVTSTWQGGFQAAVTVTNRGSAPIAAWTVAWTWPSGQTVTNVWNGTYTQTGTAVTVRNATWNGTVAPGASVTFGLTGNGNAVIPTLTCS
ncbi:cellulose binding domain-containing protein [Kutzneria chonburiensis]|uniref:Cellulose binding domain-containing protein n=1 Tax=Kutzneria chonburiensis TaxID=1483604 RepID=A0ABV6MNQ6_9PSEU